MLSSKNRIALLLPLILLWTPFVSPSEEAIENHLPLVEEAPRLRWLKGGSGGRGGGSSSRGSSSGGSSGGSSYGGGYGGFGGSGGGGGSRTTSTFVTPGVVGYRPFYGGTRNNNNNNNTYQCTDSYDATANVTTTTCTEGGEDSTAAFGFLGVSVVIMLGCGLFAYFAFLKRKRDSEANDHNLSTVAAAKTTTTNDTKDSWDFQELVSETKCEFSTTMYFTGYKLNTPPQNGTYAYTYMCKHKRLEGTSILFFTDALGGGYTISGNTTDDDGVANIEEGQCNSDGKAWWREKNVTGDEGLEVLNKGDFDFINHTFTGEWWASSRLKGTFASFKLQEKDDGTVPTSTTTY